jgi:hypothetical protein
VTKPSGNRRSEKNHVSNLGDYRTGRRLNAGPRLFESCIRLLACFPVAVEADRVRANRQGLVARRGLAWRLGRWLAWWLAGRRLARWLGLAARLGSGCGCWRCSGRSGPCRTGLLRRLLWTGTGLLRTGTRMGMGSRRMRSWRLRSIGPPFAPPYPRASEGGRAAYAAKECDLAVAKP